MDEKQKSYVQFPKITSPVFGHAHKVNNVTEPLDNQCEDGVTNVVQTFCSLKEIGIMVMELRQKCRPCVWHV